MASRIGLDTGLARKASLTTFLLNTQLLTIKYNTTRNYSAGLQLQQLNQYNRPELFAASPLAYSPITVIGSSNINPCGCTAAPQYTPCCPVQFTTNTCGVLNNVGQCVNANPF